jgi:hypothetical protein
MSYFRFHRSLKLVPGLRLNFSKRGGSLSLGGPGATVNVGSRGVRGTLGLPGTGLSYVSQQKWATRWKTKMGTSPSDGGGGAAGFGRLIAFLVVLGSVGYIYVHYMR